MTNLFFDTGILLAACGDIHPLRRHAARDAIDAAMQTKGFVTSAFVLYEFHRIACATLPMSPAEVSKLVAHLARHRVVASDANQLLRAATLQQRHALKLGDALAAQAALDAGCRVLYSDSLPPALSFEGMAGSPRLTVVDPLSAAHPQGVQEPAALYRVQRAEPSAASAVRA